MTRTKALAAAVFALALAWATPSFASVCMQACGEKASRVQELCQSTRANTPENRAHCERQAAVAFNSCMDSCGRTGVPTPDPERTPNGGGGGGTPGPTGPDPVDPIDPDPTDDPTEDDTCEDVGVLMGAAVPGLTPQQAAAIRAMEARMAVASGQPNPLAPAQPAIPAGTGTTAAPTTPLSGAHNTFADRVSISRGYHESMTHGAQTRNAAWNAERTFGARMGRFAGQAGRVAAGAFIAWNGWQAANNAYDDTVAGRGAFATFFDAAQSVFTGATWAEMQAAPKPVDPYANDGYCVKK